MSTFDLNAPESLQEPHSYIREYWQDIITGKTICGFYVKKQVEILINILNDSNYKIDFAESEKRIKFIENECRHSEAPFAGKPFKLMTFQKAIIEALFAIKVYNEELGRYVRKFQELLLVIGRKNGKALALDTKIPTPNGFKLMRDLQVGDEVYTVDGTISKVIVVSPVFRQHDCYKVYFEGGAEIVADAAHLWRVDGEGLTFTAKTEVLFGLYKNFEIRVPSYKNGGIAYKKISKIEKTETVPVKCIGIDHPSHLYLASEGYIATHNTPLASAISLAEWVCGEMGTKILYGSNDYDQADLLYLATDAMREASPKLAKCTRRNQKGLFFGNIKQRTHRGKFTSQNKGSIRKLSAKTSAKEGRNIKVGVVDEVHELVDESFVMPIKQALSTQDEPIYLEITTEGFTTDGYLDERLKLAQQVLDGAVEKPNMLIFWYCQDSEEEIWQNEQSWYKSNPTLGTVKKWSFLRGMVEDAKLSAATRAFVLAKDFNIKQNTSAAWLTRSTIENDETFDLENFRGQFYCGGVDLSETTDLCAAAALFVRPDTMKKYVLVHYFVPEVKADALIGDEKSRLNPEQKDYREFAAAGYVTICPGNEIDTSMVSEFFFNLLTNWDIRPLRVGYDPWHSKSLQHELSGYFGNDVLERIPMNFNSISNSMSMLESDLSFKKLNYRNCPVTFWNLSNVAIKINSYGQMIPVKAYKSSKNRIDGAMAIIIAYTAFSNCRKEYLDLQRMLSEKSN